MKREEDESSHVHFEKGRTFMKIIRTIQQPGRAAANRR
jgi:hypothetical protein